MKPQEIWVHSKEQWNINKNELDISTHLYLGGSTNKKMKTLIVSYSQPIKSLVDFF
jgi:hypothetical protein